MGTRYWCYHYNLPFVIWGGFFWLNMNAFNLLLNHLNQSIVMCTDCRPGGPSTLTLLSYVLGKV